MRLATWNVNSIRTRIDRVTAFLERGDIDVLAIQELKCREDQFPWQQLTDAGYEVAMVGHNQWNGVAIASRVGLSETSIGFPQTPAWGDDQVSEARAIRAIVGEKVGLPIELWSLYVPNGRELDHPHYAYKLQWLANLKEHIAAELAERPDAKISLVGDFNIAPHDEDVWSMEFFEGKTHVSQPERDAFFAFLDAGLTEVTRERVTQYTYWDYQQLRFPKNQGMRIDFVLASPALAELVTGAEIDRNERKGKGASDHVPVIVELE
ncbi:exodeoxyribonuclease III [Bowdeniella nasicola]|uniref:Exodeoxyribonuclease III n=1 Tax=Bowdeniella nasicola TaxID=208480 RepID=A0A1Q5Q1A2_9ACTO|nr:exodeoxyribonuclease III [Bowdeniella nasicola]OKL53380.1 exodeoxyribonuclease III [Bowdeniella nasicola]